MKKFALTLATLGAAVAASVPAAAREPAIGEEASIPFVSIDSIRNCRAIDRDTIYFEDRRRRWYRGEVIGPCLNLPFAQAIGVDTRGTNRLDRFSTVLVRGDRYQLTSLVRSEEPPSRKELWRQRAAEWDARRS